MSIALIIIALLLNQQALRAATYEYGEIFADYIDCATGKAAYPFCSNVDESPINIETDETKQDGDENLECNDKIDWKYSPGDFKVVKKEHTIEVEATGHAMFDNPVEIEDKELVKQFCLEQVHFHWGLSDDQGSEHTLNGRRFPLEAHFVHYNCEAGSVTNVQNKYPTKEAIEIAAASGIDTHELGVIGVWFEITESDNPAIEIILQSAALIQAEQDAEFSLFCDEEADSITECNEHEICVWDGKSAFMHSCICKDDYSGENCQHHLTLHHEEVEHASLDLRNILSAEILDKGFYTYEGSLTTPPCTDDVRWFMMKKTSYLSKRQMKLFREIKRPCKNELIAPNFRPIQDNPNDVYACIA